MRLPRNLGGEELSTLLRKYGYEITRQTGSHIRLTTAQGGAHHVTVPRHKPLRVGTLIAILKDVGQHLALDREVLLRSLFGR